MLLAEAKWLGERLASVPADGLSPLCNVGSETRAFRTVAQPWIDELLFAPLEARGVRAVHHDLKEGEGIDVRGDLFDDDVFSRLRAMKLRAVVASNILEHVPHRDAFARRLIDLLPDGGYLFVTCPRSYPFHPDPVDTLYRPSVEDLVTLFSGTELVAGQVVTCETFYEAHFRRVSWRAWFKSAARLFFPFVRPRDWVNYVRHLPWLCRPYAMTCTMLRRPSGEIRCEPDRA